MAGNMLLPGNCYVDINDNILSGSKTSKPEKKNNCFNMPTLPNIIEL